MSVRLAGQAPLVTDDAAVAAEQTVHLEFFGQFARLPAAVRPATAQHTLVLTLGYGLASRFEVGFDVPLIAILRPPRTSVGAGDLNLTAKYVLRAPTDSMAPRFAVSGAIELPTGNARRGFGSGVADYNVNVIGEWPLHPATAVRVNGGVQFAGNTLTGLVGSPDRGVVFIAGGSAAYAVMPRVTLAGELTGYQGGSASIADHEVRAQGRTHLRAQRHPDARRQSAARLVRESPVDASSRRRAGLVAAAACPMIRPTAAGLGGVRLAKQRTVASSRSSTCLTGVVPGDPMRC